MIEYYFYFRFVSDEWRGVKVFSRFLDIVVLEKGDAETKTSAVLNSIGSMDLQIDHLTAFASDGAFVRVLIALTFEFDLSFCVLRMSSCHVF